jgi:hypothetical protein
VPRIGAASPTVTAAGFPDHCFGALYKLSDEPTNRPLADESASETRISNPRHADDMIGLTGTTGESALIGMFPALPITTVSKRFPNA